MKFLNISNQKKLISVLFLSVSLLAGWFLLYGPEKKKYIEINAPDVYSRFSFEKAMNDSLMYSDIELELKNDLNSEDHNKQNLSLVMKELVSVMSIITPEDSVLLPLYLGPISYGKKGKIASIRLIFDKFPPDSKMNIPCYTFGFYKEKIN